MTITFEIWRNNAGKWMIYVVNGTGEYYHISEQFETRDEAASEFNNMTIRFPQITGDSTK